MERQLRIYEIEPGRLDDFRDAFREIAALRRSAGFGIIGPWIDRDDDRFVWLATYDGDDGFAAADTRYYASPERAAIDPDPADYIKSSSTAMVDAVDV